MRLYEAMKSQKFWDRKLFIAIDGGAAKLKGATKGKGAANFKETMNIIGSIGLLITDDVRNPFVRCYGQPVELNPRSFWLEICEALAALRLLYLYIQYSDERTDGWSVSKLTNIQIYTNSQSMINRLEEIAKYLTAKNKMTMHPKYDMLLALLSVLETYPNQPIIEWV